VDNPTNSGRASNALSSIDVPKFYTDDRYTQVVLARIIWSTLTGLVLLGLLSFFFEPRYEKGVWVVQEALFSTLSGALGAKFGMAVPRRGGVQLPDPSESTKEM